MTVQLHYQPDCIWSLLGDKALGICAKKGRAMVNVGDNIP